MNSLKTISSLGKANQTKLRNALGFKTINQAIEFYGETYAPDRFKKSKKYSDKTKSNVYILMQRDYNKIVEELQQQKQAEIKKLKKEKKVNEIKNKNSSKISKFFQNYKKPINIETNVKYGGNKVFKNYKTFVKQFVDVYRIDTTFIDYDKYKQFNITTKEEILDTDIHGIAISKSENGVNSQFDYIFYNKLLPLLGGLYKKYKNGYFQIDLIGRWKLDSSNYGDKISIEALQLSPKSYKKLYELMLSSGSPPDTKSMFTLQRIDIKFIKPINGGCYSCKGHGKNFKLNNLTLHNPYSTNNNCFFKCVEEYLNFKPTKIKCNEIRKEFNIFENEMISIQDCYKISKKYCNKSICFITNDLNMLYGDDDAEIKIFCLDNHYMTLIGETNKCKKCGQMYMKEHKCNGKVQSYYNTKIKRLITPSEIKEDNPLLNKLILHYDIETQYTNLNHQHTPYIVGFCYYKDYEFIYNEFYGDDCMKEFYEFLGSEEVKHIKYINAYNGAGFDHYYLFRQKIYGDEKVGKFILNNGNLLSAKIQGKKLIDLCRHLTGSLSSNLKQNGCSIAKGEINHNLSVRWEDTDEDRKKEVREYLKCDVLGLCELYEKVNEPIYNKYKINLCEKMTTSSNAFDIWRDHFLKEEIYLLDYEKDMNVRQSIYGARCYKNKNRFRSSQYENIINGEIKYDDIDDYIFDADVVSLYPTAMSKYPYPIGKEKSTNIYKIDKLGIYKITYIAPKNILNPILPRKENGKLIWDLNDGSGWYSSVDIENAKIKGYEINIITGYFWEQSGYIFKDYIEEFYQMKQNAIKGTPAYNTAKLYLNGLYGKMLQRPNHSKDCIVKTAEEFWSILNKNIIEEMSSVGNTWLVKYLPKPEYVFESGAEKPTQLGVFVLAYSRKIMSEHYDKCGNTIERLPYYYDTDSLNIHSSCLDKVKIDKSLGGIDDDVGGKVIKAIYIAPKMYAFQYITKEEKIKYHFRGKGVSNNELGWEDFEIMDKGQTKKFTREFQMKKINMTKNGKTQDLDHFSHKHIFREETEKEINKTLWNGRHFYDENNSVPHGFNLSLLQIA
jgi:hypothetical protein